MVRARMILVALVSLGPATALASDPNLHVGTGYDDCWVAFSPQLTQTAFHRFAREFGSVSAFKSVSSPATLGKRGAAITVEEISFSVEEKSSSWNDTFKHPNADHPLGEDHVFPKLRLRVGVSDRLDLGAFYSRNPNSNYGWLGLEAKVGMLQQGPTMPISLALRGAYTKTLYVTDMDMHAITGDVTAGRTFWGAVTPYLGGGGDLVLARESSDAVDLHSENQFVPHGVGGVEARTWHLGIGAEADWGALTSYQLQLSLMF